MTNRQKPPSQSLRFAAYAFAIVIWFLVLLRAYFVMSAPDLSPQWQFASIIPAALVAMYVSGLLHAWVKR
ncbi:MAG: hypothetical protein AAF541_06125 [Pseudomonadota bacterium]